MHHSFVSYLASSDKTSRQLARLWEPHNIMALQTPQRPLPGMFMNTPAASRISVPQPNFQRTLSGTKNGPGPYQSYEDQPKTNHQSQQSGSQQSLVTRDPDRPLQATASRTLTPIERGAQTINDALQRELGFPELDSYVQRPYHTPFMCTRSHQLT